MGISHDTATAIEYVNSADFVANNDLASNTYLQAQGYDVGDVSNTYLQTQLSDLVSNTYLQTQLGGGS